MSDYRRRGEDSRDDDRGSRRGRDDDRGSSRDRDEPRRGSSRDDDRGSRSSSRDERPSRDDDRGARSGRGGGSGYTYQARSAEDAHKRKSMGANEFDRIVKDGIPNYKVKDGENRLRIIPPTWEKPKHYGFDIYVHYGVGPDRDSYLDLTKMKDEPDPISEEYARLKSERNLSKDDEDYLKEIDSKRRVAVYVVDRDDERAGVQFYAMPWTLDRDLVAVSIDRDSGEVLPVDHPEDGYDVMFDRTGKGVGTKYTGISVARRSTPLGKNADEWMEFAMKNPIPDVLQYYDYDTIAKAFGAKGSQRDSSRGRDDDRGSRDRDEPRSRRDDPPPRERDEPRGGRREREEPSRRSEPDRPDWRAVHEMTAAELEDLIEQERLDIDPRKARDDDDLADWICDEMKIKKDEPKEERRRPAEDDEPRRRRPAEDDEPKRRGGDDPEDKLAAMRRRRGD